MKLILIFSIFIAVTSALPTLSTMFPFLFKTRRPPQTTPMPSTIRREYNLRRTTNFFTKSKGKSQEKRKFHLQVSFGPIIYPENTTPIYGEEEVAALPQRPRRPRPTTTEPPEYEQIQESEEEILSEGFTEPPKRTTTTTTTTIKPLKAAILQHFKDKLKEKDKPFKASFFQHLQEKFPKIQDWLNDSESAAATEVDSLHRQPRMPQGHSKEKHHRNPKTFYGAPKKPKHILTPPRKVAPKKPRPTTSRPRPKPTTPAPFEEEEDIQPGGQTPPPPQPRKRPTQKPTEYQQFPARPFEEEQDIQPGGQTPPLYRKGYDYQKPQQISKEIFFFEPPPQFAPNKPKPIIQKPPLQPKKQYKVIFIKAPEPEPPIIPDIPQIQPAPEQKTLIYVVAKRPEEPPKITIDAPVEASSTKPDVFFVRYKVTTTTPLPDETEEDIQPGGQLPEKSTSKPGYKYPKPTPKPTTARPKPKPRPTTTTTTPYPDEEEEDIQPGGQTEPEKPSEEYLPGKDPVDDEEEDIQPGGQLPPDNEYLPPDEEEEDIQPGGQEPTTPNPTYLPPVDEEEEDIQPGGQLPPTPTQAYLPQLPPTPTQAYLPQLPPTPTQAYLPQRPPEYGYGQDLQPGVTVPRPYSGYYPQQPDNKYLPQPPKYGTSSNSYNIPINPYGYQQQPSHTYGNYNGNSYDPNTNANSDNSLNGNSYFPQDNTYYNQKQQNQDNLYYNTKAQNLNTYFNQQKQNYIDQLEPATQIYYPQPQPLDYNERYFSRRALIHEDDALK